MPGFKIFKQITFRKKEELQKLSLDRRSTFRTKASNFPNELRENE